MSATIVRIEGEIIHHQQALEKLVLFLSKQSTPHLLVVTALPELARAIRTEIQRSHDKEYSQSGLEGFLDSLETLVNAPEGTRGESDKREAFRQQSQRLKKNQMLRARCARAFPRSCAATS